MSVSELGTAASYKDLDAPVQYSPLYFRKKFNLAASEVESILRKAGTDRRMANALAAAASIELRVYRAMKHL